MDMFGLGNQQLLQATGVSIVLATQPLSLDCESQPRTVTVLTQPRGF